MAQLSTQAAPFVVKYLNLILNNKNIVSYKLIYFVLHCVQVVDDVHFKQSAKFPPLSEHFTHFLFPMVLSDQTFPTNNFI